MPTDRAVAQAIADAPAKRVLAKGRRVLRPEAGLSQHYKTAIQMSGGLRDQALCANGALRRSLLHRWLDWKKFIIVKLSAWTRACSDLIAC